VKVEYRHLKDFYDHTLFRNRNGRSFRWNSLGKLSLMARRHDSIFMIVDTLTKISHFFPVCMMHQAPGIARVYINKIFETTRHTKGIISDKGISVCKIILDKFPKRPWEHH
jgi:hypothetical protein